MLTTSFPYGNGRGKKKISLFEKEDLKKEDENRYKGRKPEDTARSEKILKLQKTPMKTRRRLEEKMTPKSWKKKKRSALGGLLEDKVTMEGEGKVEDLTGGLRLGVTSIRRKFEKFKTWEDENLASDKLEDSQQLVE